ncbi:hypothetical protein N7517_010175 [Penicillium concentricum]|uniref:Uncharacterized protein n=1 Tax=Penicillium concentricum TaxID=293559 RepID=A0A9W9R8I0_9EURO|nr:uncharacterized protein N7517_010175 [Penicillium concentricum]KAJ5355566.1 hypothetical protein N7517_010175 [Penicillium concentricum]
MVSLRATLLCLMATSATVHGERLRAVWSSGSFSSMSGSQGGSQSGHYDGFAILNTAGDAIYTTSYPGDHSPCQHYDGRLFTLEGDCWNKALQFWCRADFGGSPEKCEVRNDKGIAIGRGDGMSDTKFIGIAIGKDASCAIEFDSDSAGCPVSEGEGPFRVV